MPEGLCFALFSSDPFDVVTIAVIAVIILFINAVATTLIIQLFRWRRSVFDMFLTIIIPI